MARRSLAHPGPPARVSRRSIAGRRPDRPGRRIDSGTGAAAPRPGAPTLPGVHRGGAGRLWLAGAAGSRDWRTGLALCPAARRPLPVGLCHAAGLARVRHLPAAVAAHSAPASAAGRTGVDHLCAGEHAFGRRDAQSRAAARGPTVVW